MGLCKTLGCNSVIDYPYKALYHDPQRKVPSLPQHPGKRYQREDIFSQLQKHDFDFIVLSAIRNEPLDTLEDLSRQGQLPPMVLIDGDDGVKINTNLFQKYRFALYFKREYLCADGLMLGYKNRWKMYGFAKSISDRIYPLPFSVVLESIPPQDCCEQDIDISFVGIASHRNRIRAVNILQSASDLKFKGNVFAESTTRQSKLVTGTLDILKAKLQGDPYATKIEQSGKLPYHEYFRLLGRSKMGLSIRGAGFDTIRYWEIVASKRLLISEQPYIHIPNNFEHGKHALFCRPDLSDLLTLVRRHVHDHAFCKAMIDEAYQHMLRYHTCEQRAKQFLAICEQRL